MWTMDYHAIHGHDVASFDTSSAHRLPTVSASQALDGLQGDPDGHVSTSLDDLDRALLGSTLGGSHGTANRGGIKRGQVTEIWGPPGTGKTAFGIQLTANALCSGNAVVWVDCFQAVSSERITSVVQATRKASGQNVSEGDDEGDGARFFHYSCLTLPHFIALVSRPTTNSIAPNVSLIVVSSLSALINSALPKGHDRGASNRPNKGPSTSAKRLQALQSIIAALQKLAATRNCAVVVLSQCATKMQSERGATLTPSVNATVWEQGISTRLVLFRDWVWQEKRAASVLLAGLQKIDGKPTYESVENVVAFKVEANGIFKVPYDTTQFPLDYSNLPLRKRKLGQTDLEIPDSEDDEDYGWAEEDEAAMPAPPPQWQGSEDILLGQEVGRSEDESNDEDGGHGEEIASDGENA